MLRLASVVLSDKVHYLRHNVSKNEIVVEPKKIKAIMGWVTPRNVEEVRSFMGLVGTTRASLGTYHLLHILLHHYIGKVRILDKQRSVKPILSS